MRQTPILALIAALLVATGCVDRAAQSQGRRTAEIINDPTQVVALGAVRRENVESTVEITGELATSDDTLVGAKVGGRLTSVLVADGDPVRPGQVVAQIDATAASEQVLQALAAVDGARAQLEQARREQRVAPQRSRAAVAAAEARVRQAEANLTKVRTGARDEERRQIQAQVEAAKSRMELAKSEHDRALRLHKEGAISKAQLDQAENAYVIARTGYEQALESRRMTDTGARPEDIAAAEQEVAAAREQLRAERAAQQLDPTYDDRVNAARASLRSAESALALARQALADHTVRSPFSGRIAGRPVQPGTVVNPGFAVARVVGVAGTYFEGQVPEELISEIRPGTSVSVRVDALRGRTFAGRVAAANPLGSDVGRLFSVRVTLEGGANGVNPGMFARGVVTLASVPDALTVPVVAVVTRRNRSGVFIVRENKAVFVPVEVGIRQGDRVQVTGLDEHDQVVVAGQATLEAGVAVRIEAERTAESGDN